MVMDNKTPVAAAAALLLLLIADAAVAPASASTLTIYRWPGCLEAVTGQCGECYTINNRGYFFRYTGDFVARFYRGFNCRGPYDTVARNLRRCNLPHPYKSVRMICLV